MSCDAQIWMLSYNIKKKKEEKKRTTLRTPVYVRTSALFHRKFVNHNRLYLKRCVIAFYNCTSLSNSFTSSPGLNGGRPMYGQPSQRNASPREQFPQLPVFPWTVKSTSAISPEFNFNADNFSSAFARWSLSSAWSFCASPQVQSLHALLRLPALGLHSGAMNC